jgi:hypothetical protein
MFAPFARRGVVVAVIVTVALLNLSAAAQESSARPKYVPKAGDFMVVCTLYNGPPKGGKVELPEVPITYDANFIIGARVEFVKFGNSPWPVGTLVNFLIHSPTLLLGWEFSGKQYTLTFSPFVPTTPEDKVWFAPETRYLLKAIEKVVPPSAGKGGGA